MEFYDELNQSNNNNHLGGGRNSHKKYTCTACHMGFDKPKVKYASSFIVEMFMYIILVFGGFAVLGLVGAGVGFFICFIFSIFRMLSKKKVCPHCNCETFFKNS